MTRKSATPAGGGQAETPSDRVLIPLPGLGLLVLEREAFEAGLVAAAEFTPASVTGSNALPGEPLLEANKAAAQLGVTPRWLEDSARAGIVPHYKLGRFIRFRVSEIVAHCRIGGA